MTFKEFIFELQEQLRLNPEWADKEVIFSENGDFPLKSISIFIDKNIVIIEPGSM